MYIMYWLLIYLILSSARSHRYGRQGAAAADDDDDDDDGSYGNATGYSGTWLWTYFITNHSH